MSESDREERAGRERAQTVGLWRYSLVQEAMDEQLTGRERGLLVRAIASREHQGPFGTRVRVSRKTLDRWIRARRRGGFDALVPSPRRVTPRTLESVLALAVSLKKENPRRTAAQVRRVLAELSDGGWAPSERTLQRLFVSHELNTRPDGRAPTAYGRFEADRINEIWTADTAHGPKIGGRKTYIVAIIDDHSRLLVGYQCSYRDDAARFRAVFRDAIAHHGIPGTLYADNGAPYVDESLLRTCARLGIRVTHSAPGRPQGRGKVERLFRSMREQFLVEIHGEKDNPVGCYVEDLAQMQDSLNKWVKRIYHRRTHSQTGQTPLARWADGDPAALPGAEQLRQAFAWTMTRLVRKTATVDLEGNTYRVDPFLVGRKVELHFDPFDLAVIEVYWAGRPVGKAVPQHIGRHAHPKAPAEVEPEPIAPTGINFIELLTDAHNAEIGQRLNLSHLTDDDEHLDNNPNQAGQVDP